MVVRRRGLETNIKVYFNCTTMFFGYRYDRRIQGTAQFPFFIHFLNYTWNATVPQYGTNCSYERLFVKKDELSLDGGKRRLHIILVIKKLEWWIKARSTKTIHFLFPSFLTGVTGLPYLAPSRCRRWQTDDDAAAGGLRSAAADLLVVVVGPGRGRGGLLADGPPGHGRPAAAARRAEHLGRARGREGHGAVEAESAGEKANKKG